jgi:hypothetical protein
VVIECGVECRLVLCSAVWMHLEENEREVGMRTVRRLLATDGIAVLTLRHPPDSTRHMFDVNARETIGLAAATGLVPLMCERARDPVREWRRNSVSWTTIVLARKA